jgi:drug/metabolite transporter (DMT)-like permease
MSWAVRQLLILPCFPVSGATLLRARIPPAAGYLIFQEPITLRYAVGIALIVVVVVATGTPA